MFNYIIIYTLLASSLEYPQRIRVVSVFETLDCLLDSWLCVSKFSHFSLFHPPLFIQYSTEECSTAQYKAAGPPSRDCSECDYRICSRMNLKTHYQTNCNGCAKRFCGRCHLKTHNTFREAVRLYNILAHSTQ